MKPPVYSDYLPIAAARNRRSLHTKPYQTLPPRVSVAPAHDGPCPPPIRSSFPGRTDPKCSQARASSGSLPVLKNRKSVFFAKNISKKPCKSPLMRKKLTKSVFEYKKNSQKGLFVDIAATGVVAFFALSQITGIIGSSLIAPRGRYPA